MAVIERRTETKMKNWNLKSNENLASNGHLLNIRPTGQKPSALFWPITAAYQLFHIQLSFLLFLKCYSPFLYRRFATNHTKNVVFQMRLSGMWMRLFRDRWDRISDPTARTQVDVFRNALLPLPVFFFSYSPYLSFSSPHTWRLQMETRGESSSWEETPAVFYSPVSWTARLNRSTTWL